MKNGPATPVVRAAFRRTRHVWERTMTECLERLPDSALHWRLGKGHTIAQILTHIGAVVQFYQHALHNGLGSRVPQPIYGIGDEWRAFYDEVYYIRHERVWYEELLSRSYAEYMEVLPGVTDADLDTICTTLGAGAKRTVEWILHQVPGHTDYHIGQINYILGRYEEAGASGQSEEAARTLPP